MNPVAIGRVVWPGYVGIGAGLVKNGAMLLDYAGRADSVEIGSITRHFQEGNAGRTVWKYAAEQSLRHNAGMPNEGIEHVVEDLIRVQSDVTVPWGINVAVTPGITDPREAALDIRETVHLLLVSGVEPDWITVNVASPDTEDPVDVLSEPERVKQILTAVKAEMVSNDNPPLWLKVGPAMSNGRLAELVTVAVEAGAEALVCGNTLPDRHGGGWCGAFARPSANAALYKLKQLTGDRLPIIGTGGILAGEDAQHKLDLGAAAVQVAAAALLRGRNAAREINRELERLL